MKVCLSISGTYVERYTLEVPYKVGKRLIKEMTEEDFKFFIDNPKTVYEQERDPSTFQIDQVKGLNN